MNKKIYMDIESQKFEHELLMVFQKAKLAGSKDIIEYDVLSKKLEAEAIYLSAEKKQNQIRQQMSWYKIIRLNFLLN